MTLPTDWYAHPTAIIDSPVEIGRGTRIWHFSHVSAHAAIGEGCSLGQNVYVASGVRIGNRAKIQNNVSVYTGTTLEDDVFLGPSSVFTNVTNPRSEVNRRAVCEPTLIRRGVTVGANATVVCGVTLGRYAFVAAGAVVSKSAPEYALLAGVPARRVGWMSRHGHRLSFVDGQARCPESGLRYEQRADVVCCIDLDEDAPLPEAFAVGVKPYREFEDPPGRP